MSPDTDAHTRPGSLSIVDVNARRCCALAHLEAKPHGVHMPRRDEPGDSALIG
jgi:hypothetical protein